jgi:hypothetical protein
VAGVVADPRLRPDIIQEGAGGVDFRSLYKIAIRPALGSVAASAAVPWQPSSDPFVSNPFREERIDDSWVARRKNKLRGAEFLRDIVQYVASTPQDAKPVLQELALHELERLSHSRIHYRIPPRLTTAIVARLMQEWLAGGAGGRRLESASIALLRFVGQRLSQGWDIVESHHVNDPRPYDALCRERGAVRAIGEVKDQPVKLIHVRQLAEEMANHNAIRGYLLTLGTWWPDHAESERLQIEDFIRDRSILGLRIDVIDLMEAIRVWLALADQEDEALPAFLRTLTDELDAHGLLSDRQSLAHLLDQL